MIKDSLNNYCRRTLIVFLFFCGCAYSLHIQASLNLRFNHYTPSDDLYVDYDSNNEIYSFYTTGSDPYVFIAPLSRKLTEKETIFSFEYKCDSVIDYLKIYYGQYSSEVKSSKFSGLEPTSEWKLISLNLTSDLNVFNWGYKSNVLRIDFGDCSGVSFQIRKLHIHSSDGQDFYQEDINKPTFSKLIETGLPLLSIVTVNNEEPTCDFIDAPEGALGYGITNAEKVKGRLVIYVSDSLNPMYDSGKIGMNIKIRGNSSARGYKKPYKIKLSEAEDILFRNSSHKVFDKNWVLLKDNNLKNFLGFKLNNLLGLEWTPSARYVNLMINDCYKGVYLLAEAVERNPQGRINVAEDGFIFEQDAYWWNEDFSLENNLESNLGYTLKYPDTDILTNEDIDYLTDLILNYESSLLDGTYEEYIDVESFALWILGHDIYGSYDSAGTNLFFSKYDRTTNSKIKLTTLWDFDGEMMCGDNWSRNHTITQCFRRLFNSDNPHFRNVYFQKWNELNDTIFKVIPEFLDSFSLSSEGQGLSRSIIFDNYLYYESNPLVDESGREIKKWFSSRKQWLANNISDENSVKYRDIIDNSLRVYCKDSYLYVDKLDNEMVFVYSMLGERLYGGHDSVIFVPTKGCYIVHVGDNYCKILVK
ncbi:MAG: CotH kinase family protein [Paludibacteraceae bacterium]|nr:CotH kinase family protein [Paludibacteraceae bacterium]